MRFRGRADRERFVAAHVCWRAILSSYLQTPPEQIEFGYGAFGKPHLTRPSSSVQFSGSHSGDIGGIAVAHDAAVGLDLECRDRTVTDVLSLAEVCFSDDERAELAAHPDREHLPLFLRGWTQKESVAKALGEGLQAALQRIPISLQAGEPFVSLPGWQVIPLSPGPRAIASLCVPADRHWRLVERWWPSQGRQSQTP